MGDETRQITNKLEDVIRGMASEVTETRVTQATLIANVGNMHKDIKKINGRVTAVEKDNDSLKSTRDKNRGMVKVLSWLGGFLIGLPSIAYGIIKVVEWIKP